MELKKDLIKTFENFNKLNDQISSLTHLSDQILQDIAFTKNHEAHLKNALKH